ncbi:hypothetical protein HN371_21885 [Candidatus Poribacteria bacterium]|jgi:hypothetical protein|nr:hypothetical protein [Candidatus Poribacteria bacterium]MBT5536768.1 hypothetical protein [Candidatus Poribacteria bacterium]MBT7098480.1 hypothetical protein [Candidatus Poribacteria bacterium]MBT7807047.1 hypothetical protein [Candidatus Poribacteria bacterium]
MRGSRLRPLFTIGVLTGGLLLATGAVIAQDKTFTIINDEASVDDLIPELTSGGGAAEVEAADVYPDAEAGAALRLEGVGGDFQRFNTQISDWAFQIVDDPTAADEFRYITFAWKKQGGTGMQLQVHGAPGDWGHRYHAGDNMQAWNPSIQVTPDFPDDWQIHTRDLFEDWGEFTLTGLAFSPSSLDFGIYDHMALHQSEVDPLTAQAVDPKGKSAAVWAEIKQDIR